MGGVGNVREESQGFFEMLWDCEYCEARGLLGKTQRYCANCGAPQNPEKRYFPEQGKAQRVDGHVYEGADRRCPSCNTPQSAKAHNCTHCGSPLDGGAKVQGLVSPEAAVPAPARKPRKKIWVIVVGAIALMSIAIWWRCLRTEEARVSVAGHAWQRAIAIEELRDQQDDAWHDQVPGDARQIHCRERERSTRKIEDGEECSMERRDMKDGTFEQVKTCRPTYRSEPVMDRWCSYTVRRWAEVTTAKASGKGMSPAWPSDVPPSSGSERLGARRQGKRTESLILDFGANGTCDVREAVWRKYADGQSVTAAVRASSRQVVCSSL